MIFMICAVLFLAGCELGTFLYCQNRLKAMQKQIDELDPQAGIDAAALEKAFNEGVQHIMDYSLHRAMGGNLNG